MKKGTMQVTIGEGFLYAGVLVLAPLGVQCWVRDKVGCYVCGVKKDYLWYFGIFLIVVGVLTSPVEFVGKSDEEEP